MFAALSSDLVVNIVASLIVSGFFLAAGFLWGKYKERRKFGRNLEEYDFYPFTVNRENLAEFNLNNFRLGMHYFLKNHDYTAARQLIFIGEQSNVRTQLEPSRAKGICAPVRQIRRTQDCRRHGRVPRKLRANCPADRPLFSPHRD